MREPPGDFALKPLGIPLRMQRRQLPRKSFRADRQSPKPIWRRSAGVFRRKTSAIASSMISIRRQSRDGASSPLLSPFGILPSCPHASLVTPHRLLPHRHTLPKDEVADSR